MFFFYFFFFLYFYRAHAQARRLAKLAEGTIGVGMMLKDIIRFLRFSCDCFVGHQSINLTHLYGTIMRYWIVLEFLALSQLAKN